MLDQVREKWIYHHFFLNKYVYIQFLFCFFIGRPLVLEFVEQLRYGCFFLNFDRFSFLKSYSLLGPIVKAKLWLIFQNIQLIFRNVKYVF
jgi:hypothetical protein